MIGRGSIGGGGGFGRGRDSPSPSERYAAPVVFLLPATILIVLFFMLPVVTTLGLSMTDISTLTFRQPKWVGLENYRALLGDPSVGRIMVNTARYVVFTLLFNVGMGLMLALLSTSIPARYGNQFRAVWLLPRILPAVVYVQIGLNHSIHHRGQLSMYLRPMGAKVPSIYGESYDSKPKQA